METYAIDYLDLFSQPVPTLQTVDIWYFAVHFAKEFGWNPKPETFLCGTFPSEFSIYLSLLGIAYPKHGIIVDSSEFLVNVQNWRLLFQSYSYPEHKIFTLDNRNFVIMAANIRLYFYFQAREQLKLIFEKVESSLITNLPAQRTSRKPLLSLLGEGSKGRISELTVSADEAKLNSAFAGRYCIFLGQLSYSTTVKIIKAFFVKHGISGVVDVRLLTDKATGKSRGMALVDFDSEASFYSALKLHRTPLDGRLVIMGSSAMGLKTANEWMRPKKISDPEYKVEKLIKKYIAFGKIRKCYFDGHLKTFLKTVPFASARSVLEEIASSNLTKVIDSGAYIMSIIKRHCSSAEPLNEGLSLSSYKKLDNTAFDDGGGNKKNTESLKDPSETINTRKFNNQIHICRKRKHMKVKYGY
ncbi:uncharacterized protein LOC135141091 [Zophobas morio]|uniref:uncharacterized protein LOC135141091 n=1 Tax=Zophobas morio TaxID=2755281 RepID=UPI00308301DD